MAHMLHIVCKYAKRQSVVANKALNLL